MEQKKKSNVGMIVLIVVICALVGVIGFLLGNKNVNEEDTKLDDTVQGENTNTSAENTNTSVENTNYIHVFERINNANGYNVYSYLENQGTINVIVDYNDELYMVSENNQSVCLSNLYSGSAKFNNNSYDCSLDGSNGNIYKLNLKTSDISNAYIMQSYRSDGASFVLAVLKNGTVNKYDLVDGGQVTENYFDGSKVNSIEKYECSKNGEYGCEEEQFTVTLQDGTTKEL